MTFRRASFVFVLAGSAACITACKKESAPPPEVAERQGATEALTRMEQAAADFAKGLTEQKVKGVLTYEQLMLEHAQAQSSRDGGQKTREARLSELTAATRQALEQGGVTQAEVTHFTTLTAELFAGEVAVAHAREELSANPAKVERWKALEAEAAKLPEEEKFAFLQQHLEEQPLTDFMIDAYQKQLAEQEARREAFALRHGADTLALIDRYRDDFVALRKQQLEAVLGEKKERTPPR